MHEQSGEIAAPEPSLIVERARSNRWRSRVEALWLLLSQPGVSQGGLWRVVLGETARRLGMEAALVGPIMGGRFTADLMVRDGLPVENFAFPIAGTLAEYTLQVGRGVAVRDLLADPHLRDRWTIDVFGVRSYVGATSGPDDAPYFIGFASTQARTADFDPEDVEYVELLAAVFARSLRSERQERELRRLRSYDPVTGLPDRDAFVHRMDEIVAGRGSSATFYAFVIGLSDVQDFVRTHGPYVVNEMLAQTAARLREHCDPQTLFRGDGATFIGVCADVETPDAADARVRSLARAFEAPFAIGADLLNLTACVGAAAYPTDGETPDEVLNAALSALGEAHRDRHRLHLFGEKANARIAERELLYERLVAAFERGEFELHYQPIVELARGTTVGAEALIRWRAPGSGLVLPDEFIPFAEETGLIDRLGLWVMASGIAQIAEWFRAGKTVPISLNVSAQQFHDPSFFDTLYGLTQRFCVDPSHVGIELTESTAMRDVARARKVMERCKEAGFTLALDDFGTGHSSLAYLKHLPVDVIKIDRSFLEGLPDDRYDTTLVAAIVGVVNGVGKAVIAEGVETQRQAQWLHSVGCAFGQGYLFGRPVEAADLFPE